MIVFNKIQILNKHKVNLYKEIKNNKDHINSNNKTQIINKINHKISKLIKQLKIKIMKIMFHNNKISHKINKYNQINTYNKKKFTFSKKKIIKMMDKNK